jgi:hypothetical protein
MMTIHGQRHENFKFKPLAMKPQGFEVKIVANHDKKEIDAPKKQPNVLSLEFEGWFQVIIIEK